MSDEFKTFDSIFSDPAVTCTPGEKNRLYFVSRNSEHSGIWAYDLKEKKTVWQYFEKDLELLPPATKDGKVYVLSRDGRIFCFKE